MPYFLSGPSGPLFSIPRCSLFLGEALGEAGGRGDETSAPDAKDSCLVSVLLRLGLSLCRFSSRLDGYRTHGNASLRGTGDQALPAGGGRMHSLQEGGWVELRRPENGLHVEKLVITQAGNNHAIGKLMERGIPCSKNRVPHCCGHIHA